MKVKSNKSLVQKKLTKNQIDELLQLLKVRFEKNMHRHKGIPWSNIKVKLEANYSALRSLHEMEGSGGEPDVVAFDKKNDTYVFFDCSPESPVGRRSLCYDMEGWDSRKEHHPENTAIDLAAEMGVQLLNEEEYSYLQTLGKFDTKTSSWLLTPESIRKHGGAIFGDFRYETVFIYHNGAGSYYAGRGFRASVKV